MTQEMLFEDVATFTNRSTSAVTFKGKMALPIHRWYRLTASFSPKLAHDIADHFKLTAGDTVLDPFSGVGTVPLCMKYRDIPACSIEINPYLHFVGIVKTRTYRDVDEIERAFGAFLSEFRQEIKRLPAEKESRRYLWENAAFLPPIHNAERWWSLGNLMQLTCLRKLLLGYGHLCSLRVCVGRHRTNAQTAEQKRSV